MGRRSEDVSEYIDSAREPHRAMMMTLREVVHQVEPDIAEDVAYKMPVFKRGETMLMGVASRAKYLAMYFDPEAVDRYRDALGMLDAGKGCVRVTRPEDLPMGTIRDILRTARAGLCGQ
ncbi:MAG: hypothetical protein GVY11_01630 [Gammaproteobacteria bacterium]|jgi:uncharacterized protein YdhG (YjbR/CyaY superfamily)|nr:hypothetical protein [Gammaproteobacteria bacterium]